MNENSATPIIPGELQLGAIREVLRATTEALPLVEILAVIANMVIIVIDAPAAWIILREEGRLQMAVARGTLADRLFGVESITRPECWCAPGLRGETVELSPAQINPADPLIGGFSGSGLSIVFVPIRTAKGIAGLLGCAIPPSRAANRSFLAILAEQAATALTNAHLREESRTWRERLDAVFESMPESVLVYDRDGTLALMNGSADKLLGPKGVLVGEPIAEVVLKMSPRYADGRPVAPDDTAATRALRGERVTVLEERLATADGVERYVLTSGVPLTVGRQVLGAVVVVRDITSLKQAEAERTTLLHQLDAERAWLRTVIDQSPIGILLVEGPRGERIVANRRAEQLFGRRLPPEGGVSQYVGQLYHIDGPPLRRDEIVVERALHGSTVPGNEELVRQPSGQDLRVRVSAVPIRENGRVLGAVVIYEDLTDIREFERLREEWTSIIAHDLRQPVTIISGYGDLLAKRLTPQTPPDVWRAVEHIRTSARNLNKMIGDLLDISRIITRRLILERQQVDLPTLIHAAVERATEIIGNHRVTVAVTGAIPPLDVDPGRIEQVLDNLLSNAAKYGFPGTEILVTVTPGDDEAFVSVTNHGPGIQPGDLSKIFTRFYRTPRAQAGRKEGLGLGLYISKGLVEAHGGRIWAESTPDKTTTFTFSLPLSSTTSGKH